MNVYGVLSGKIAAQGAIFGVIRGAQGIEGKLTAPQYVYPPAYTGEYTITPGDTEQVLQTEQLLMTGNVTIKPVPSNYGRITWNGSVITVS